MGAKKKQTMQETGRWLRVGTLMLTTLGPVVNLLTERLRERKEGVKGNARADAKSSHINAFPFDAQEKLQTVGSALTEVLVQLREHPYSQELLQRGGHLTDDLQERWNWFPHDVAKRNIRSGQEARKIIHIQQKKQAEQERRLWIFLGFGVGISGATIATVLFLRRRQKQPDDVSPIQLYNGAVNHIGPEYKKGSKQADKMDGVSKVKADTQQSRQVVAAPGVALANTKKEESKLGASKDATLVGVVSAMRYFPIETPSDQLPTIHGQALDLIYFTSEAEAKAHGFTAAE